MFAVLLSGVPVGNVFGDVPWCFSDALGCPVVLVVLLLFFCLVSRLVMFLVVCSGAVPVLSQWCLSRGSCGVSALF